MLISSLKTFSQKWSHKCLPRSENDDDGEEEEKDETDPIAYCVNARLRVYVWAYVYVRLRIGERVISRVSVCAHVNMSMVVSGVCGREGIRVPVCAITCVIDMVTACAFTCAYDCACSRRP